MPRERDTQHMVSAGAWFWLGPEMIHLMVLPNPDPMEGRPEVGHQAWCNLCTLRGHCQAVESLVTVDITGTIYYQAEGTS